MIKVKKRKILLLPGDGIGPEVIGEVKKIIKWFNDNKSLDFEIEEGLAGGARGYEAIGPALCSEKFSWQRSGYAHAAQRQHGS